MRSSVMPSLKYSCCGSSLRFANGSTAMDGLSGRASAVRTSDTRGEKVHLATPPTPMRSTRSPTASTRRRLARDAARRGRRRRRVRQYPVHAYRLRNVLHDVLAEPRIPHRQLVFDLVVGSARKTDATALGQPLNAGRDVDPIPVETIALNNHIPQVDTDTEHHLAGRWQRSVAGFEVVLNRDGTLHRIDHAGELREQVIPRGVHHAAPMRLDVCGHHLAVGGEGADGGHFIVAHEAAVALDIGAEDGRELALDAGEGHSSLLRTVSAEHAHAAQAN